MWLQPLSYTLAASVTYGCLSHRGKEGIFPPLRNEEDSPPGKDVKGGRGAFTCLLGLSMDVSPWTVFRLFPVAKEGGKSSFLPPFSLLFAWKESLPPAGEKGEKRCAQSRTRRIEASSGIVKQNCKGRKIRENNTGKHGHTRPAPCRDFYPSGIILPPPQVLWLLQGFALSAARPFSGIHLSSEDIILF